MRKKQERVLVRSLREIPRFASEDEERQWWATHDLADELWQPATTEDVAILDELRGAQQAHIHPQAEPKSAPPKQVARGIALDPKQAKTVARIAQRKKVDPETLIKEWITQGIARERVQKARKIGAYSREQ
jgi:hypothetical protein